ncbi:hypothetical protein Cni_G20669 [Canna indica]|uniref:Beta-fructofuranosidase n=1 Tax=Canna indica TaxID=4628 RepID=A0AAQ3KNJ9_9LILI|nr:hypothetical protein Cni_G20669 [Canna indica]
MATPEAPLIHSIEDMKRRLLTWLDFDVAPPLGTASGVGGSVDSVMEQRRARKKIRAVDGALIAGNCCNSARAIDVAEKRIAADRWPEYYDTKQARWIGKQARLLQTWSIVGFLVAKLLIKNPDAARNIYMEP